MPAIKFKTSSVGSAAPTDGELVHGELAFNTTDRRGYQGTVSNTTSKIIDSVAAQSSSSVNISGGSITVTNVGSTATGNLRTNNLTIGGTTINNTAQEGVSANTTAAITAKGVVSKTELSKNKLKNIYQFTSVGATTYTKSGPDVKKLHVIVCGGGGGGRGYAESGGAGGYAERVIDATGISTVTVTVGGGGGGGAYFGFSGSGGTTSFGSYVSASGGTGANAHIQHNGGPGGLGSNGNINSYGGGGGGHNNMDQYNNSSAPGLGGASYFGGMTPSAHSSGTQPDTVASWGAGGVAVSASHNGQGGRNGRQGICIVYEYK